MHITLAGDPLAFEGDFETHVTVRGDRTDVDHLERWAAGAELKLTLITLGRGRVPVQPMITLRGSGTLGAQYTAAGVVVGRLETAGFEVARVKIEASPCTRGVPGDDEAALRLGAGCYFEHHVKLLLDAGCDVAALTRLVVPHGAHVSWNARRVLDPGRHERFVTQRCHGLGLAAAGKSLEELCTMLYECGYEIVSVEREFVVFDSDASLDAGWIERNAIRA
ncbi:hypothetical protein KGA66_10975 [Actinocrinis puniceicyclus]|uniref:Ankyrin n=1 Tax=Actinocrinis puniceicyclus TaxID=977794 RepID=A0A8J7WPK9_9ACTN|nr:hypothetical protein [Actinocrinis puniceicyclus]MBS2963572.1 hypothetical protein [Actinocrinis puniceicyclus]